MQFHSLKLFVRVDIWIFVVKTNHKAYVYNIWFHAIKKRASIDIVL